MPSTDTLARREVDVGRATANHVVKRCRHHVASKTSPASGGPVISSGRR